MCGLMILMGVYDFEEDKKNQKFLVGYGSLAETSVLFTITPISSQYPTLIITDRADSP